MAEPLTQAELGRLRRAIETDTLTGWPVEKVALIDTALHYEARSRETGELLVEAQNRLREVEAELARRAERAEEAGDMLASKAEQHLDTGRGDLDGALDRWRETRAL